MPDGAKIINTLKSANYISGRKIFLLDSIDTETCAELIGNISNMVDELHWRPEAIGINLGPIPNPYSLPKNAPQVIDICIDSPGGQLSVNKSIMSLLNLARAKDTIIRTFITGNASSCASLIAVQGTPGFRIMYEQSYNLIHYGRCVYSVTNPIEIDKAAKYEKEMRDSFFAPYLQYTNITKRELLKYQLTEYSQISAYDCPDKKMCEWILTSQGTFINRKTKQR